MKFLAPIILNTYRTSRQLRVTVQLPKGHTLRGMAVQGSTLLVEHVCRQQPEQILSHALNLEAPVSGPESSCFIKQKNDEEMVILWGPLDQAARRRSA